MAEDSTTAARASGAAEAQADGTRAGSETTTSTCHVVHDDQIGELHLSRETGERVGQRQIAVTLDVYTHVMPLDEIPESAYLEVKPSLELDARQQYDTIVTSASRARYPAASRRSVGVLDDRRWQPMPSSKTTDALGANGRNVGFLELGGRACRSRN
jgi:hypothetical protein